MGQRSVARIWLLLGTVWVLAGFSFRALLAQDAAPVEFEMAPETVVRTGPSAWSLAVSPDGKWAVAGLEDGRILIRETIEHKLVHAIQGHEGAVTAITFHPSGNVFASAGQDGKILLWNVSSGRLQTPLAGHDNWITALAFSPDGTSLASAGYDKTVRLWNTTTGEQSRVLSDLSATVRSLSYSPDGQTLAFAGDEGQVRFWNLKTGTHDTPLPEQPGGIRAVAYSPDGKTVLTVPSEGNSRIWNLETKQSAKELNSEDSSAMRPTMPRDADPTPQTARFSPDGLSVLVATRGGQVRMWSVVTGQLFQTLSGHEDVVTALAMASEGNALYTTGLDGKLLAWPAQLPVQSPLCKLPISSGKVWALALSPEGKHLAVAGKDGFVELWDVSTGQRQRAFRQFEGTVDCLDFSADGKLLAAAGWREKTALVWNVETGDVVSRVLGQAKIYSISISPDRKQLAVGYNNPDGNGPQIFPIDPNDGTSPRFLDGHELTVYAVAYSPDGSKIASASGEWTERKPGRVMIHNAADGTKLAQFDNHSHAVRSLTFTPDGSKLCSLSQDGVLTVYEMSGLRESVRLTNGIDSRPNASSPDGRRIAVGLQNGNINIWNLERREIERRLKGTDDVFSLEFSRDGSLLFAADGNESVQFWRLSEDKNTLAQSVQSWLSQPAVAESPKDSTPKETP